MIFSESPVQALVASDALSQKVIGEAIHVHQADIVVEKRLLLELKAVSVLVAAHEVQLVNYLTATKLDVGLLLNFGAKSLEIKSRTRGYLNAKGAGDSLPSPHINHINPI